MPLDPVARAPLDQVAASSVPSVEVLPLTEARAVFEAMSGSRGEKLALGRVEDRRIPGPASEIPVQIATPEGQAPCRGGSFTTAAAG